VQARFLLLLLLLLLLESWSKSIPSGAQYVISAKHISHIQV
jgi:hypothetical protein